MKTRTIINLAVLAIAIGAVSLWMGQVSYSWFPPQASAEAVLYDRLFSFLVALGTFIFLGVFGTVGYSILFQRAGKYDTSDGLHLEGNWTLEIVWTIIPFLLVIWIAWYSYQTYSEMAILGGIDNFPMQHHGGGGKAIAATLPEKSGEVGNTGESQQIEVRARQWAWEFYYPEKNVTSTELHLPNQQRAHLVLKSEDVLHGFYVPAFRIKQDVIPGRAIAFDFTPIREGRYRVRDSEYSGTYFAAMQTDAIVESPEAYQKWLAEIATKTPTPSYNQAFAEYQRPRFGWKTVEPAPPPVVNAPSVVQSEPS